MHKLLGIFCIITLLLVQLRHCTSNTNKSRSEWACKGLGGRLHSIRPWSTAAILQNTWKYDYEIIEKVSESEPYYGEPEVVYDWVNCTDLISCSMGRAEARSVEVGFKLGVELPAVAKEIFEKMGDNFNFTDARISTSSDVCNLEPCTPSAMRLLHSFLYVDIVAKARVFKVNECGDVKDERVRKIHLKAPTDDRGHWQLEYRIDPPSPTYKLRDKTIPVTKFKNTSRVDGVSSFGDCCKVMDDRGGVAALWDGRKCCDVVHADDWKSRMFDRYGNFLGFYSMYEDHVVAITHTPKIKSRWIKNGECDLIHVYPTHDSYSFSIDSVADEYRCIVLPAAEASGEGVAFHREALEDKKDLMDRDEAAYFVRGVLFTAGERRVAVPANNPNECSKLLEKNNRGADLAIFTPNYKSCEFRDAKSSSTISSYDKHGKYLGNWDIYGFDAEATFDPQTVKTWLDEGRCHIISSWFDEVLGSGASKEGAFVYRCKLFTRASVSAVTMFKRAGIRGMDLQSRLRDSCVKI